MLFIEKKVTEKYKYGINNFIITFVSNQLNREISIYNQSLKCWRELLYSSSKIPKSNFKFL